MLRLDPAYPPVWSTPTRLQLGAEPVAILDDPAPWEQRLLYDLEQGFPESALAAVALQYDVAEDKARAFLTRVRGALERTHHPPAGRVRLEVADSVAPADAAAVADALAAHELLAPEPSSSGPRADRLPVVLVVHHVVDPRHAAALMRDDVPHLPIVLAGSRAIVGPYVRPGVTACLACVAAHRTDAEPSWPAIAAQLLGRRGAPAGRAFAFEAGLAAGRLLSPPESLRPVGHSLTLSAATVRRVWRAHPPHADCRCRSLGENATPVVRLDPYRATRRATVSAPHA
jgi:hypothetical protein